MVGDTEVWNKPENALVLLLFHFFRGHLHRIHRHFDTGHHCGHRQNNWRHQITSGPRSILR